MKGCRALTKEEAERVKKCFSGRMSVRDLAYFRFAINTGFRVSEILSLKLKDVIDERGRVKGYVTVSRANMKKTKGVTSGRTIKMPPAARDALVPWLQQLARDGYTHQEDFLFQSCRNGTNKAVDKHVVYRFLIKAFKRCGLQGNLGTHTTRKSFAGFVYEHALGRVAGGEPVDPFRMVSQALGHVDINSTSNYLSFLTEDVDYAIESIQL